LNNNYLHIAIINNKCSVGITDILKKNGGLCIKACQLVLKTTKTTYLQHDHDKVKGNKFTCFCVDKLVSNSDLLCSVDISH